MKKLIYITIVLFAGLSIFSSCGPEVELPVLTEDEYPRIIGRWPEKSGDQLGQMGGRTGAEFTLNLQFTPSNLCTGIWYLDGEEYTTGTSFSYMTDTPGTYHLKLIVSTPKYTTSREALLVIEKID